MNKDCDSPQAHPAYARPLAGLPRLTTVCRPDEARPVPDDAQCFALWDKYDMLPNIRRHSMLVAHIATTLALLAKEIGLATNVAEVRASGLLHDIAKTYCVRHGGSHAQVGASWIVSETGNHAVAQGVMLHVWWPWDVPDGQEICALPFYVMYADKRIRHDKCVTLQARYEDLLNRYGVTKEARQGIDLAYRQGQHIESALEAQLGLSLHENSFDCGRVVHRA
ncbi:MAG: HDIG domain-containing protein [Desulfovibrio sp.]|nr:HDIG domain-containing protein [Desulfovibrio sp.]